MTLQDMQEMAIERGDCLIKARDALLKIAGHPTISAKCAQDMVAIALAGLHDSEPESVKDVVNG